MSRFFTLLALLVFVSWLGCNQGNSEKDESDKHQSKSVIKDSLTTDADLVNPSSEDSTKTSLDTTKNIPVIQKEAEIVKPRRIGPRISFETLTYDFGKIKQGDKVKKTFNFSSTGDMPLNIMDASASCGCTIPSYPFIPINPGEKGRIEVIFDSKLKEGQQNAKITVITDAPPGQFDLHMIGFVEKPTPKEAADSSETQ